jgi:phosphoribosylglycinamide formyltransferase-1
MSARELTSPSAASEVLAGGESPPASASEAHAGFDSPPPTASDVLVSDVIASSAPAKDGFRIAVFASGSGSNFQAIVDAAAAGRLDAQVVLLVCDKPDAPVIRRAEQAQVPTFVFRPKDYPGREAYEAEIVAKLQALGVDLVVLAGYMRLVTQTLLAPYAGRIINIHPSLLPSFPGVNSVGQALAYGVKVTGVTVHYVDSGLDSGPIILQQPVEVLDGDSEESLSGRIHALEHELYLQAIRLIRENKLEVDGRVVRLRSATGPLTS